MSTGTYLSEEQVALLLKPIHTQRVLKLKGMSYVEGYDIRAELNRVFGFGRWDQEILDQAVLREAQVKTKEGNAAWNVVYRTRVRLTVKAPDGSPLSVQEAAHVGESTHPVFGEAHGNAVTNSETYALRRCAINWGDQFGLSLYNKGATAALVRWTLVRPETESPADTDDVPQVHAEQGDGSQDDGSTAAPAGTDMSAWKTRIAAAAGTGGLDKILADAQLFHDQGNLTVGDMARIRGLLDGRAAEFDRATRQPARAASGAGDAGAEQVTAFKTQIAKGEVTGMRIEIAKAVHAKAISPEAANDLVTLLRDRTASLEEARDDAA